VTRRSTVPSAAAFRTPWASVFCCATATGGTVTVDAQGNPVAHYALSQFDRGPPCATASFPQRAFLEAAGARHIFSPHAKWCAFEPGRDGSIESFARSMDSAGWGFRPCALFAFHIMGFRAARQFAKNFCDKS